MLKLCKTVRGAVNSKLQVDICMLKLLSQCKISRVYVNINYRWSKTPIIRLCYKTVRGAVNINYRWISYVKTVRGAVNINYRCSLC